MRGRAGVVAFVVALFAAGVAAGAIQAGSPLSLTTTSDTTTTPATTDVTTQPATTAATTTTTTAATTTTAPTTTTVAPPPKPRPAANPAGKLLTATPLGTPRCAVLAGFALLEPGRSPMTLGDVAVLPRARNVSQIGVAYPANGSVLTASSVSLRGSGCGPSARGNAHVGSLSLFGGALTVQGVELGVSKGSAGTGASVTGLSVGTAPVAATPGRPIVIGSWGYVVALAQPDRTQAGALAVHLTRAHAGLPSGTVLLVGFAQLAPSDVKTQAARPAPAKAPTAKTRAQPKLKQQRPQVVQRPKKVTKPTKPKRRKRKHHLGDDPLKLTPRLGLSNYVFPVAGVSSYIDTYGGYRGDVPGNWHHGEDIFASLGTPVVAVADGTLNRVGWEHLGGWRLWDKRYSDAV